ncbi:hypothetical protein V6R21_24620 [Limibacter armeniacum]|uniref:hypothetical protein n=1 Tax=Limibacter armeniacum TaxID=466084 RepID=UPI002FE69989
MRQIILLLVILTISCSQQTAKEDKVQNDSIAKPDLVTEPIQVEQTKKIQADYSTIVNNFPEINSLDIDSEQLQKSRYTKYHSERGLNNYYFELSELTTADKKIIDIEDKENSRLFYFGRTAIGDSNIVLILKNDTTSEGIKDTYYAQVLNSSNEVEKTFELAKIDAPEIEESTETTSKQIDGKVLRTTIYELYETPVDEEPLKRTERQDTISLKK